MVIIPNASSVVQRIAAITVRQLYTAVRSGARVTALLAGVFGVAAFVQCFTQVTAGHVGVVRPFGVVSAQTVHSGANLMNSPATVIMQSMLMQPSVALVCKVVRDVSCKEAFNDWQIARPGVTLSSGDRVKTGEASVAVIKFKDNSLVLVRERSVLTVTGATKGSLFSKSVNVENGAVEFNIKKQRSDEEFRFSSPTSVASIRGTGGQFVSCLLSDTLTLIEGAVVLTNLLSFESVDIQAGYTGISNPDGTIFVRIASPDELSRASGASRENKETMQVVWHLQECGAANKLAREASL